MAPHSITLEYREDVSKTECIYYLCMHNIGEGNGNPLQYSYLENPMDRGAW